MALVIDGTGDITGLTRGAIESTAIGTGAVLQVVQVTSSTQLTTTSATMSSTGVSATITPTSSSSKILVLVNAGVGVSSSGGGGVAIARNGSVVWNPSVNDSSGYYQFYAVGTAIRAMVGLSYLDSPSTTSATTYALFFAARGNTVYINETGNTSSGGTTITLMEIAG